MSGIRVNFTDTEKYGNSSLGLDPLPTGKYHVAITDAEIRDSKSTEGAQYINFEFTVQSGEHEGRKLWTIASLQPHALFTLKGIMEAIGMETTGWQGELDLDDFINEELVVKANFVKAHEYTDQRTGEKKQADDRNEVKRFYKLDSNGAKSGSVSGGSLLP